MAYRDLRAFISLLKKRGLLRRITAEVEAELEITEITDRVCKTGGPALFFEKVKGYQIPVVTNLFGSLERVKLALEVTMLDEIGPKLVHLFQRAGQPLTFLDKLKALPQLAHLASLFPKVVKDGPCKEIIIKELDEIKQKYQDQRRTQIIKEQLTQINEEELVPDEISIVTLSQNDYLRRLKPETFKLQKRGGKGILSYQKEDQIKEIIASNNRSLLMLFSNLGKIYYLKTYEIPLALRTNRGKHINNFLNLASQEKIVSIISYHQDNKNEFSYLTLATKNGLIKKVKLNDLISRIRSGIRVINIKRDDGLISANFTSGKDEILLATKNGMIIKFKESDLRPLGRNSSGVKGINLKNNDELLIMEVVSDYKTQKLLIVTAGGYAKIVSLKEIKNQRRGGVGIKIIKLTDNY